MSQEQFRLQTRWFNAFFGEEIRAFLDAFEDSHAGKATGSDGLKRACKSVPPKACFR